MAFRGQFLGVVTATALLFTLSACGDDESPEPDIGGDPTESTSAADPTTTATSEPTVPFDFEGLDFHEGRITAGNATKQAVVDAWLAYWEVRGEAYHHRRVDLDALGELARGSAVDEVVGYVAELKQGGTKIEGDTRVGVSEVKIVGSSAAVKSCIASKVREVGTAKDDIYYANVVGSLEQDNGQWFVTTQTVTGEEKCR